MSILLLPVSCKKKTIFFALSLSLEKEPPINLIYYDIVYLTLFYLRNFKHFSLYNQLSIYLLAHYFICPYLIPLPSCLLSLTPCLLFIISAQQTIINLLYIITLNS